MTTRTFTVPSQSQLQRQRGIYRVQFCELQRLRAVDLQDEQTFRLALRRRHHLQQHDWGIVVGLALAQSDKSDEIVLQPGVAIDGYGREIVVAQNIIFNRDQLATWQADIQLSMMRGENNQHIDHFEIWLRYNDDDDEQAVLDSNMSRFVEDVRIYRRVIMQGQVGTRQFDKDPILTEVMLADNIPPATRGVFLGNLSFYSDGRPNINSDGRRYAEAYAGSILAPTGYVRLLLAPEEAFDARRFAIGTRSQQGPYRERLIFDSGRDSKRETQNRAQINGTLDVTFLPNATIKPVMLMQAQPERSPRNLARERRGDKDKDTVLEADKRQSSPIMRFDPFSETPKDALPWHIYSTTITVGDTPQTQHKITELRIELLDPGKEGFPDLNRIAIGAKRIGDFSFKPTFLVSADGTVTVDGVLDAEEIVVVGSDVDPTLAQLAEVLDELGQTITIDQGLSITISGPLSVLIGTTVRLAAVVKNTSGATLTSVYLTPLIIVGENNPDQRPISIDRLSAGEERTIQLPEFQVKDAGTCTVVVMGSARINRSTMISKNSVPYTITVTTQQSPPTPPVR